MAYNQCSGVNQPVFGPPEQTLFLGCSIASFSTSVGWNEQIGELTVTLVQDTCPVPGGGNPKVYWDSTLTKQTTTAADPGFLKPNVGSPVYFRVGSFEWSGLVQSWEQNNSLSGKPTYTVKMTDPRQLLQGAQLIVGNWAGTVALTPNVFNVYGYAESFGNPAPPTVVNGATFGSPAGAFGGSASNDNGMPWYIVQMCTSVLCGSLAPIGNMWSPYGRILFREGYGLDPVTTGQNDNIGYGIIPGDGFGLSSYLVDLSDMPAAPIYWKLAGTSMSILDAVSQICSDACYDYYIELLPTIYDDTLLKIIKVRTVSRAGQATLGQIAAYVSNIPNSINYSEGEELRNEVTSAFIVGGAIQNIYQAYQNIPPQGNDSDIICPYFGLDGYGNVVEPFQDTNGMWQFYADLTVLNTQLNFPLAINTALITELELLSALGGPDSWAMMAAETNSQLFLASPQMNRSILNAQVLVDWTNNGILSQIPGPRPIDMINLKADTAEQIFQGEIDADNNAIYEFVASYARNYYGRKYMVRLPYTTAKADPESALNGGLPVITTTEQPSDGGWTDAFAVLGLPNPSVLTDFFTLQDNRLGCFVAMEAPSGLDSTMISPQDVFTTYNYDTGDSWVYVRASVEPDLVFVDSSSFYSPRVVVTMAQPIVDKVLALNNDETVFLLI